MEVVVDFNDTDEVPTLNYPNGTTIKASVTSVETDEWEAEGADDLDPTTQISGTAVGDAHTLVAEGIVVPASGFDGTDTETQGQDFLLGIFNLEFEVTAVEGDFYIANFADEEATFGAAGNVDATTGGIGFLVEDAGVAPTSVGATLSSTADEDGVSGAFIVREGETETFTLRVTVDAGVAGAGDHRVVLGEVWYSADTDGIGAGALPYLTTPTTDYRSDYETINQI
jgi:hypothetical protein